LGIANPKDYLDIATSEVRAADALRDDMVAVLFPRGMALPTEVLQTRVKLKLLALVGSIEDALVGRRDTDNAPTLSWDILAQSGVLREKQLVNFALARVSEDQLQKRLMASSGTLVLAQLPTVLLSHENAQIAQMAQSLLRAEQRALFEDQLFCRLDPAQLHALCGKIVTALQEATGSENPKYSARADELLQTPHSDADPAIIARKLVFFLGHERRQELTDPCKAGLQLFIAGLAQYHGLTSDMVFRLIGEASVAPLLSMLKGADVPIKQLPVTLTALYRADGIERSPDIAQIYSALDPVDARAQIANWAQYL
jgi:hypothetical protein